MSAWMEYAQKMLNAYDRLAGKQQKAYVSLIDYKGFIYELSTAMDAVKNVEDICKNGGSCLKPYHDCKEYILRNVIGNVSKRRVMQGISMLQYFDKQKVLLTNENVNINISSDIIESDFGICRMKKSPNKLYRIALLPLSCFCLYSQNSRMRILLKHLIPKSA